MKIETKPKLTFELYITLTEEEARALDAITCYGIKAFLKTFYENIGKHYLSPHEEGAKSLFANVRSKIPEDLQKIDETRKIWEEQ